MLALLCSLLALSPAPQTPDPLPLLVPFRAQIPAEGPQGLAGVASQRDPRISGRAWYLQALGAAPRRPAPPAKDQPLPAQAPRWRAVADSMELHAGGSRRLRFANRFDPKQFVATYKPFLQVFVPGRQQAITKGAGGSFSHHRGLFYGFNRTSWGTDRARKADFWHCSKGSHIRHLAFDAPNQGPVFAEVQSRHAWRSGRGETALEERRRIRAYVPSDRLAIYDVELRLSHDHPEPVFLRGDPQHAGLQYRAAQEVHARQEESRYLRPAGAAPQGNDVWQGCDWVALRHPLKQGQRDRRFLILLMRAPDNRGKGTVSTRAYGRFGFFFQTEVRRDQPLVQRYRLVVYEETGSKPLDAGSCQALYDHWLKN